MLNSSSITPQEMFFLICIIAPFLYSIYHVSRNKNLNSYRKTIWILALVFGSFVGLSLYWIYGRNVYHNTRNRKT
ncbi:PLD nuclease N-terminal domain-containing protein [Sphingobacterium thalpophilum]